MAGDTEIISAVFNDIINDAGYPYDNIFPKTPIVKYFLARDSMDGSQLGVNNRVRTKPGGNKIEIPIEYGEGDAMQFYNGWDVITFTPQETMTNVEYDWKNGVAKLILSNIDIDKCNGEAKKIEDLVKSKLRNMNKTLIKGINTAFLTTAPGAKDFLSIPKIVAVDPTVSNSEVGGINQFTYSWWRNQTKTSTATTFALLMRELRNLRNTCAYNAAGDEPDLLVVDQIVWEYILAHLDVKGTHSFIDAEMTKLMNMDIKKVEGMNVIWDTGVPESDATHSASYLLNTDYLQFVIHENRKFKLSSPISPVPTGDGIQDATAWTVFLMGELTSSNRNKQGVLHTISQALVA